MISNGERHLQSDLGQSQSWWAAVMILGSDWSPVPASLSLLSNKEPQHNPDMKTVSWEASLPELVSLLSSCVTSAPCFYFNVISIN